jgi:hypothetical protein
MGFITLRAHLRKEESPKINHLNFHLRKPEEDEITFQARKRNNKMKMGQMK